MRRAAAIALAVFVGAMAVYLGVRVHEGLEFRTDLMALLPREERDPAGARAKDAVVRAASQRILVLVGHADRAKARAAAARLSDALDRSGLAGVARTGLDRDQVRQIGKLYFPYRRGLLSESDRTRLEQGRGEEIARRALAQVFGFVGMADAWLLRRDPFLLMPAFLAELPLPASRLAVDEGMLGTTAEWLTWIMISARLTGEPFAVEFQERFTGLFDRAVAALRAEEPALDVLRLGAVFFARAGADKALTEASRIGLASVAGTILLVLFVFRALTPLWLGLLGIGVGVLSALGLSLYVFGELHVFVLLFGVSMIGIAVDYALHYCCEVFAPEPAPPRERLARVLPGITLGLATSVIGYATFLFAPFPGLHQVAFFSVIGLLAAFATVVLWLPSLDRSRPAPGPVPMLRTATRFCAFFEQPRYRTARVALVMLLVGIAGIGATRLRADDDVRRMQSLDPELVGEQARIQRLIGAASAAQFFLIEGADDESVLQVEESLAGRLHVLRVGGALGAFHSPARFVPSAARQRENRRLVRERLEVPFLDAHVARLGLAGPVVLGDDSAPPLDVETAMGVPALAALLSTLRMDEEAPGVRHVVAVEGVVRPEEVARAAEGIAGVHFVDMAGDVSRLLAKYRERSVWLVVISAFLMLPMLVWRYGVSRGLAVLTPPLAAAMVTPMLQALAGRPFTFFDAIALVLVLSIGVDYAIFVAESRRAWMTRTIVAIWIAAMTTTLSFGLLSLSRVAAVQAFGSTMLIGILLAVLLAPLAARQGARE